MQAKQIFVNLAVENLDRSVAFFSEMGFEFNPQFTDKNATCMIINENIFVMLLVKSYFKTFLVDVEMADSSKSVEVLNALAVETREAVDEMLRRALEAGAVEYRSPQDHGFMYLRSFRDLDGHIWEFFFMDETQMPAKP